MIFEGSFYQLLPMKGIRSFAGKWIEVSKKKDEGIELLYEGKRIPYVEAVDKGILKIKSFVKTFLFTAFLLLK